MLVVIPLGIPDFVVSFGWRAIFPSFGGFWAAVLVMSVAVYPLVYLPVAASLRNADPAQEEVARSLGLGRLATFWRVTVGQARLAILGGAVLVGLVVLAEFGAFEILGFRTLTTEIYTEFSVGFSTPAGCAFSLILVLLGGVLLLGEGRCAGEAAAPGWVRAWPASCGRCRWGAPAPPPWPGWLCWSRWPWGCPVGSIVYLIVQRGQLDLAARLSPRRRRQHLLLLGLCRPAGYRGGSPDRPPLHPVPPPGGAHPGAVQHVGTGGAGTGHRSRLHLFHRALPLRVSCTRRPCS